MMYIIAMEMLATCCIFFLVALKPENIAMWCHKHAHTKTNTDTHKTLLYYAHKENM